MLVYQRVYQSRQKLMMNRGGTPDRKINGYIVHLKTPPDKKKETHLYTNHHFFGFHVNFRGCTVKDDDFPQPPLFVFLTLRGSYFMTSFEVTK